MRLHDVRGSGPNRLLGGGLHIGGGFESIAIEHDDIVAGPAQQQPADQTDRTAARMTIRTGSDLPAPALSGAMGSVV
jgi:hypothetical protein